MRLFSINGTLFVELNIVKVDKLKLLDNSQNKMKYTSPAATKLPFCETATQLKGLGIR